MSADRNEQYFNFYLYASMSLCVFLCHPMYVTVWQISLIAHDPPPTMLVYVCCPFFCLSFWVFLCLRCLSNPHLSLCLCIYVCHSVYPCTVVEMSHSLYVRAPARVWICLSVSLSSVIVDMVGRSLQVACLAVPSSDTCLSSSPDRLAYSWQWGLRRET